MYISEELENVMVYLDDEYYNGCMRELEDEILNKRLELISSEYNAAINSNFITFRRIHVTA